MKHSLISSLLMMSVLSVSSSRASAGVAYTCDGFDISALQWKDGGNNYLVVVQGPALAEVYSTFVNPALKPFKEFDLDVGLQHGRILTAATKNPEVTFTMSSDQKAGVLNIRGPVGIERFICTK